MFIIGAGGVIMGIVISIDDNYELLNFVKTTFNTEASKPKRST
jgi:hypothetical protein